MSIKPGTYDFTIYQGATFSRVLTWKDANDTLINVTGYTARLQIRTSPDAPTPFITLTTENGGITLGGALGTISLLITAPQTAAIVEAAGVYDLEMVSGSVVTRLLQGNVDISREVTK
jgi:hypothetical protein